MQAKPVSLGAKKTAGSAGQWFGPRLWRKLSYFWKLQLLVWGLFGVYDFFGRVSFWGDVGFAAILTLCLEPLYVATTVPMRNVYRRVLFRRVGAFRIVLLILSLSSAGALIQFLAAEGLQRVLAGFGLTGMGEGRYVVRLVYHFLVFALWSVGYFWFKTWLSEREERAKRMAAAAAAQRAELEMLRFQLNPHFLFNSLNNIHTEIFERPKVASRMILQLADYLRYSLDQQGKLLVPLAREIEMAREYLGIEEERFGDRLKIFIRHPEGPLKQLVPCFLLQPLIENAVKHGLNSSEPPWQLTLEIEQTGDVMKIRVSNTGRLDPDWDRDEAGGTGIENLKRRLALHYPGSNHFEMSQKDDIVTVEVGLKGEPCQV